MYVCIYACVCVLKTSESMYTEPICLSASPLGSAGDSCLAQSKTDTGNGHIVTVIVIGDKEMQGKHG